MNCITAPWDQNQTATPNEPSSYRGDMPTGPLHDYVVNSTVNGEFTQVATPCRCMIGADHVDGPFPGAAEHDDEAEGMSFAGAEEIWLSSGMDEDYDFR